jgi:hypothetical protein
MALIVAVVVPVLLLGIGALVVDVGGWYVGRAQDQNGADAAAVAVAKTCAAGTCDKSVASKYIDPVSSPNGDLAHQASVVCGVSVLANGIQDPHLDLCPAGLETTDPSHPKACPAAAGSNYVDVLARPVNSSDNGNGTITSLFGHGAQAIGACAQSAWGPAAFDGGVSITIAQCQWQKDTAAGYAPLPPYTFSPNTYPSATLERKIMLTLPSDDSCGASVAGGFGELTPDSGTCYTTPLDTDVYPSNPGTGNDGGWAKNCATTFGADVDSQKVVEIPVYVATSGNGTKGTYTVSTLAAFVITGYNIASGAGDKVSYRNSQVPGSSYADVTKACKKSCIVGFYVQYVDPDAQAGEGIGHGVSVPPKLTG